jgi:transcriptional regulator with XRE-family HTH domain
MSSLTKEEKFEKIIEKFEASTLTIYELAKKTKLNQSGLKRLLNREVKNPHEATIDKLYGYLYSKNIVDKPTPKTRTFQGVEINVSEITYDILKNPELYEGDAAFSAFLESRVLQGVREFFEKMNIPVIDRRE